jgi:hypothetical protein
VSKIARPLEYGKQVTLQPLEELAAGTRNFYLTLDASAVIISLYVPTLSGNVDCRVYTRTDEGHEVLLKQFTQVTSAMSELSLLRVDDTMGEVRIELISTGTSEIEVKARAAHSVSDVNIDAEIDESALVVSNPSIQNVSLAVAGDEYTVTLPANCKRFLARVRGNSRIQLSYTSGQSGTVYITLWPGYEYIEDNINRIQTLLYVQSSKTEVLEVVSWQ